MKTSLKTEIAKLKEMTFKEKRWYIWEYYKLWFFFIAFFGYIFISLLNIWVINPSREEYLYLAWTGRSIPIYYLQELSDSLEVIVENPARQVVAVHSYAAGATQQENMAVQTRFVGMMMLNSIHAFLTPYEMIVGFAEEGYLRSVMGVLTYVAEQDAELYAYLRTRLIQLTYNVHGTGRYQTDTLAISLAGSPLLARLEIDSENLYLTVIRGAERNYQIAKALGVFFE